MTQAMEKTNTASVERVATVVAALIDNIRDVMVQHKVTLGEYAAAKQYVIEVGRADEWPLFGDVFFESTAEKL